ncbi:DNA polymerase III subunit gamma/tau [Adlercreutzia equolifaciens]|uniref:DNA polymerase III subunit gamma/tau n=1 Tax=Adlercreutzia equolifaciens TaxID=446660 RepID=UPI0023B0D23A|nr:DNA polymerase III subunit gamma/tau [Adlercreutzia equolifaciens]MDE8703468.1 DNA polymerase III subunit gamma/tau [Adlercreutzia equolifaciens]
MAEALYRKYRPQIFEDVVGQEHIERTLKNAIEQDKVSHAYLFTGPRGTGKTTTARLLAKALLCECGPTSEPDGTCEDCQMIAAGEHPDVYELDAASRTGVENVREEIIGRVSYAPTRGRYKVYIIDEVHMLSTAAFNALLKTLEEPPSHVVFILATTDPQKVPETIHSRCQRFDFRRISTEAMVARLGAICELEHVEFEGEALELVAHRAEGGMRNALTSLEQLIAFGDGAVTMAVAERMLGSVDSTDLADIVRAIGARDGAGCFRWVAEYVETGADLAQFVQQLSDHLRNMYVMAVAGGDVPLEVSDATRRELTEELPLFGVDRLARLLGVLGDVSAELKTSTNPRLSFEIALTRMVRPESDVTLEALAERIEALERSLAGGAVAPVPAAVPAPAPVVAPASAPKGAPASAPAAEAALAPVPSSAAAPASIAAEPSAAPAPAASAPAPAVAPAAPEPAPASESPASAAGAPVVAAGGPLAAGLEEQLRNPASLQRLWHTAQGTLKKAKAAYGALFLTTKAVFDPASSSLVIEFPAESEFAFRVVQKPEVQQELARALQQAAGAPLAFSLRQMKGAASASAASTAPTSSASPMAAPAAPARSAAASPSAPAPSSVAPMPAPAAPTAPAPASAVAPASAAAPALAAPTAEPLPPEPDTVSSASPGFPDPSLTALDDVPPYDDYVPYEDDDIPFEPRSTAPAPSAPAPAPTPAPVSPAEVPPWEAAPAAPSAPVAAEPTSAASTLVPAPAPDPAAPAVSSDELNASLAFGFGEGISFEEVL